MLHVRMTDDLKSRLERAAKEAGRSLNAETIQRIENSFVTPVLGEKNQEDIEYQRKIFQSHEKLYEAQGKLLKNLKDSTDTLSLMALGFLDKIMEVNTDEKLVSSLNSLYLVLRAISASIDNEEEVRSLLQDGDPQTRAPEDFIQRVMRSIRKNSLEDFEK